MKRGGVPEPPGRKEALDAAMERSCARAAKPKPKPKTKGRKKSRRNPRPGRFLQTRKDIWHRKKN